LAVEIACRAVLPGFKIPRRVVFIDALPRLGTEKIDLAACRRRLLAAAIP
jgi:acyl-CoA synthetase (AMP-forming)/AMP-acid ligase II